MRPGPLTGSVFAVGVDYDATEHQILPASVEDARRVRIFFENAGFHPHSDIEELSRADVPRLVAALEGWSDELRGRSFAGRTIVYIAGHGSIHNGRHYILTASSPAKAPYSVTKAVCSDQVVDTVVNSGTSSALIILDACYSAHAADEIEAVLRRIAMSRGTAGADIAVLVPSLHHERSYSGVFVEHVLSSLQDGSQACNWSDNDEYVTPYELREELRLLLRDDQCAYVAGRDGVKVIPNPRFRVGTLTASGVIAGLLESLPTDSRMHFVTKASGAESDLAGWFFSGRSQILERCASWFEDSPAGVLVVTGSPGAGKSAILGYLAILSDRESRLRALQLGMLDGSKVSLPPGTFDAVLNVSHKRIDEVARELAAQLGFEIADTTVSAATDVMLNIVDNARPVTILIDSLDEAEAGHEVLIARDIARAIASLPGSRVVVGTRWDRDGVASRLSGSPLVESLRPRLAGHTVIDLDAETGSADLDIQNFVEARLAASSRGGWPTSELRKAAAEEVSRQASGVFLFARFAVRFLESAEESLLQDQAWRETLLSASSRSGLNDVIAADLDRFDDPELFRDALAALAFSHGPGLPRREVWPEVATTIASSGSGRTYSAGDISRVIREAGWYLIESGEDGQGVFRLFHEWLARYLRESVAMGRESLEQ